MAALSTSNIASIPPNLKNLLETNSDERTSWQSGADKITVPTMLYGGWFDLFTNSEVKMFNQILLPPSQKKLIMGGYHMTIGGDSPNQRHPARLDVLQKAWFDKWLQGHRQRHRQVQSGHPQAGGRQVDQRRAVPARCSGSACT